MRLLILVWFTIGIVGAKVNVDVANDVIEAINKWTDEKNPTKILSIIADKLIDMADLSNVTLRLEKSEKETIQKLEKFLNESFNLFKGQGNGFDAAETRSELIEDQLYALSRNILEFLNTSLPQNKTLIEGLGEICMDDNFGVQKMAELLRQKLTKECDGENRYKAYFALNNTLEGIREKTTKEEKWHRERIFRASFQISPNDLFEVFKEFEKMKTMKVTENKSSTDLLLALIEKKPKLNSTCLTDAVIIGNLGDYQSVTKFATNVGNQLQELTKAALFCGKFLYSNDESGLKTYQNAIEKEIQQTSAFFADYIRKRMDDTSVIEYHIVERAIREEKHSKLSSEFYKKANLLIKHVGSPKLIKQVFTSITDGRNNRKHGSYLYCSPPWCTPLMNVNGIDAAIHRFVHKSYRDSQRRNEDLHVWLRGIRSKLTSDLFEEVKFLPMNKVREKLEEKGIKLTNRDNAHSVAITRHWVIWTKGPCEQLNVYGAQAIYWDNRETAGFGRDYVCFTVHFFL